MKHTFCIALNFYAIQKHEPFIRLEIRAIRVVDGDARWVSFDDPHGDFVSVYGTSADNELTYCIADCLDLETARNVANTFNTFAGFSLHIIEHPKV
jgi:hypothetical protein